MLLLFGFSWGDNTKCDPSASNLAHFLISTGGVGVYANSFFGVVSLDILKISGRCGQLKKAFWEKPWWILTHEEAGSLGGEKTKLLT